MPRTSGNNFDWREIASNLVPQIASPMQQDEAKYQAAARQLDQNAEAEQKMAEFMQYQKLLQSASPYAPSQSNASSYVATPAFYGDDPSVNRAMAERTFTAMQSMPQQALFGRRGPKGEIIPDDGYRLAQEVARARGLDPMGKEAAALYGSTVDRFMQERYNDALKYRKAYGSPEDSYERYVDFNQIGVTGDPTSLPSNPNAVNMSYWTGTPRDNGGPQSRMYIPGQLREPLPVPELYEQDPLRVNLYRSRGKQ